MTYYLGIDGGGSKTTALVVDETMTAKGRGLAGPSNHLRVGIDAAARELERAIHDAVAEAGITTLDVHFAYAGIAGADHPQHRQRVIETFRTFFPNNNFTVDGDARIALTAGVGFGPGVAVISGTGSVAFGRNARGQEARAGGWGPTIGDEGSGYAIARRGLSAVVRSYDGRGPQTLITDLVCSRFDLCDPTELPFFVYAPTTHADDIAAYYRIVTDAANRGDAVALEIFEREGAELGHTALAVVRRLGMQDDEVLVATVGGAFKAEGLLLDPFRRHLWEGAPHAVIRPPVESPVEGAARMAIAAATSARESRRP